MDFTTIFDIKGKVSENKIRLRALTKEDLELLLVQSGFKSLLFYGSFDESRYNHKYYGTIVRAK